MNMNAQRSDGRIPHRWLTGEVADVIQPNVSSRLFPPRDLATGVAFLVLRVGVGAGAALLSLGLCPCPSWTGFPLIVLIICTLLGFCSRLAGAVCAAMMIAVAFETGGLGGVRAGLQAAPAIALALLGGGTFSLDALLFGRRVIDVGR